MLDGKSTFLMRINQHASLHFRRFEEAKTKHVVRYNGNAEEAARQYAEEHRGQNLPSANSFRRLAARLYSSCSFQTSLESAVCSCQISTARANEVLEQFDRDGILSIRHRLGISKSSVHRILQENTLHPYKYIMRCIDKWLPLGMNWWFASTGQFQP
ncbi:uncharacterized protein LOC105661915 [Megachile rotundata]|uniref:uncharacterized protein LOC105661915 n=1 Tax=Megachile rotundata TaxID=143995 RepID=UPI003FD59A0D